MIGIYFSGTGNTGYCTEKMLELLGVPVKSVSMENTEAAVEAICENEEILFAYPVQFSNMPYYVRDFIQKNADLWRGKQILCMATMGMFSGDGAGCGARLLRKYGANILGGLHLMMPDSLSINEFMRRKPWENKELIQQANKKMEKAAAKIQKSKYPQDGLDPISRAMGFCFQRLWMRRRTSRYIDAVKVDDKCVDCGKCVLYCPTENLRMKDGKVIIGKQCTLCGRCLSRCPNGALTLLGKKTDETSCIDRYL